jgi:hypothetical protein
MLFLAHMVLAARGIRRFEIGFGWFFTFEPRKRLTIEWLGINGACDTVV